MASGSKRVRESKRRKKEKEVKEECKKRKQKTGKKFLDDAKSLNKT